MTSKTHVTFAILAGVIVAQATKTDMIYMVPGAMATAMLPDTDQEIKLLRHRGQSHSLLWPGLLYLASMYVKVGKYTLWGMAIGWLTHILLLDIFNGKGCELFWPLSDKNFHVADIKYDGAGERAICYLSVIGIIINMIGVGNIKIIAKGWMK